MDKNILDKVNEEMLRQDTKWGEQNYKPEKWNSILMEEVGEVAKATLENDGENYLEELIQVIAVAWQTYKSVIRQGLLNDSLR